MAHKHLPVAFSKLQSLIQMKIRYAIALLLFTLPLASVDSVLRPEMVVQSGHTAVAVTALAISPNGQLLASGGNDGQVILWRTSTGRQLRNLRGALSPQQEPISAIGFSPNASYLVAGAGAVLLMLDVTTGHELASLRMPAEITAATFSGDGKWLAWSTGGSLKLWRLPADPSTWSHPADKGIQTVSGIPVGSHQTIFSLVFSHDSRWLACGYSDGELIVFDTSATSAPHRLSGAREPIAAMAFGPGDSQFAAASANEVLLWDVANLSGPNPVSLAPVRRLPHPDLV